MLIDIHTHILQAESNNQLRFIVGLHSLGIHPWELTLPFNEAQWAEKFLKLKKAFNLKTLAIGECGLDRRREGIVDCKIQEIVLGWHMDWAQEVQRPLILHCVKAEADLIALLKSRKYKGRILLHDFSGNFETAQAFLKYDCFFSFGSKLFNPSSRASVVMKSLPRDKIFLETDDQKDFSIKDIYQKAGSDLNIDEKNCEEIFLSNLINFFSDLDDISSADIINDLRTPAST
ncbi:MAG: TatD family hydrolase [Bacteriovorax sp.]|nr:TatD family hydrolase [Bacteriovorax sp.]